VGRGRFGWAGFSAYAEMRKEIHQVLDFQRFASFRIHSAFIPHPFRKLVILLKICYIKLKQRINSLTFNALQTSLKCLIFNTFTHAKRCGRVLGGCWAGAKQGIRWFGLVLN